MDTLRYRFLLTAICLPIIFLSHPSSALEENFEQYKKQQNAAFAAFLAEEEKDYAAFQAEIEKKWGEFIGSTRKVWVDYDPKKESRSRIDYEKGEIQVDVLIPADQKQPEIAAGEKIKSQLRRLISARLADGQSPLADQVAAVEKKTLTVKNLNTFMRDQLRKKITVSPKIIAPRGAVPQQIVSVKFPMVPNHIKIRANRFKPLVMRFSKDRIDPSKVRFDPSFVFAIIHTESFFNPMARSPVPAYGLMQLVPSTGGRDAYRYVFHEDKIPSPKFLYDPENNIRLGVGYLELTKERYFAGVRNPGILYLLTVASYNTGPGNVARALTGKRHLKPAIKVAQSMEIEEVYRTLRKKLPYKETQDYIQKVLQRAKMYRGM